MPVVHVYNEELFPGICVRQSVVVRTIRDGQEIRLKKFAFKESRGLHPQRQVMHKPFLLTDLALVLFCVACGNGLKAGFGNSTIGNFTNASLSGSYAYEINGYDINAGTFFREAGVFTADGKGGISAGEDDLTEGSTVSSNSTSGSYSVSANGTGTLTINLNTTGSGISFALTVVNSSKAYLSVNAVANSAPVNGSGVAVLQTASALSSVPSGTFVFTQHNVSTSQGSSASVGRFTVSGGAVAGNEDVNRAGALNSLTITGGLFNAPDASGRGTGNFVDSLGVTSGFFYYVVDSTHLFFLANPAASSGTSATGIGLGQAVGQSGSFTTSTFSGGYAFSSRADDSFSVDGLNTVGSFTAGGDGTISAGLLDSDQDGAPTASPVAFTGSYTMASNGRAVVTINPSGGSSYQQFFWMASPSQAFFLTNDATIEEDGVAKAQQVASLSNSTLNGQFGLVMGGYNPAGAFDRVGTLHWDGKGNLSLNEFANSAGFSQTPGLLSGSYSVATGTNGRVTGSINTVSNSFVFYMISSSEGYILQNDSNTEISGDMSQQ